LHTLNNFKLGFLSVGIWGSWWLVRAQWARGSFLLPPSIPEANIAPTFPVVVAVGRKGGWILRGLQVLKMHLSWGYFIFSPPALYSVQNCSH
jgi:hypothetical protein